MNNPTTPARRMHPLIAVAAGAVIVASLAATAAITGVFPKASSSSVQNDQTQAAQVSSQPVVDSAAPANTPSTSLTSQQQQPQRQLPQQPGEPQAPSAQAAQPAPGQVQYAGQPGQPSYAQPSGQQPTQQQQYAQQQQLAQQPYAQPQQQPNAQPAYCATCGTVESIAAMRHEGHGTGIGAVGGAVAGGLIGNQFGAGTGRTAMTVLGAVGGGFAGNSVEKHLRSETSYQVRVRMQNGHLRYFNYREAPPFQQGERVHIERGALAAG